MAFPLLPFVDRPVGSVTSGTARPTGAPQLILQAPPVALGPPPSTSMSSPTDPVGTVVVTSPVLQVPLRKGVDVYNQPTYDPPKTAMLGPYQSDTTSCQCGASPGPTPPVGALPPTRFNTLPSGGRIAPDGNKTFWAIAAALLLLWALAGWSLKDY